MGAVAKDNEVLVAFKTRGAAMALINRKLRGDRKGEQIEADAKLAKGNSFLKGWKPEDAEASKKLLAVLQEEQDADDKKIAALAAEARKVSDNKDDHDKMKEANKRHGDKSADELIALRDQYQTEINTLQADLNTVQREIDYRARSEQLLAALNIRTDTDRAILDKILHPDKPKTTTKVNSPGAK